VFPGTSVATQTGAWTLAPRWYCTIALHVVDSHMKVGKHCFPGCAKKTLPD